MTGRHVPRLFCDEPGCSMTLDPDIVPRAHRSFPSNTVVGLRAEARLKGWTRRRNEHFDGPGRDDDLCPLHRTGPNRGASGRPRLDLRDTAASGHLAAGLCADDCTADPRSVTCN